jgi:hypothetical protein
MGPVRINKGKSRRRKSILTIPKRASARATSLWVRSRANKWSESGGKRGTGLILQMYEEFARRILTT